METWLTYSAAFLLGGATAIAFPNQTVFSSVMTYLTAFITSAGVFLFIPVSFITAVSGVASLRKDKVGRKVFGVNLLWAVFTTLLLSLLAFPLSGILDFTFPAAPSADGDSIAMLNAYTSSLDPLGVISLMNSIFLPLFLLAVAFGKALTPSADIIRPAYTVMNSFSEVMYRMERVISYFGAFFVYIASASFFLGLIGNDAFMTFRSFFMDMALSCLALILVVLPVLFAFFTRFRKNPYPVIGRSLSTMLLAFVSGNIFLSSLQGQSITRQSHGVQKRIVSVSTPLGILITRGGTGFVSTVTVLSVLKSLNASIPATAAPVIILSVSLLTLLSSMSAGSETAVVTILLFRLLNINVYGMEASVIALLPFLNAAAAMIDSVLITMSSVIAAKATRTDITVPLRDAL